VPARLLFVTYLMLTVLAARGLGRLTWPDEWKLNRGTLTVAGTSGAVATNVAVNGSAATG